MTYPNLPVLASGNEAQHYEFLTYAINGIAVEVNTALTADVGTILRVKSGNRPPHYTELTKKINEIIDVLNDNGGTVAKLELLPSGNIPAHRAGVVAKVNEIIDFVNAIE